MSERPAAPGGDAVLVVACREFVELGTEHLEGTLPDEIERAIEAHLELCEPCVEYLEQTRDRAAAGNRAHCSPSACGEGRLLGVFTALHGPGTDSRSEG